MTILGTPTTHPAPSLTAEALTGVDAWWRAANYLTLGQIYLLENPLLREPLRPEHIKQRLLGHWGTTPGLNLIYAHLNRVIQQRDANLLYIAGPGHGGPGMVANAYLDGTYTERYDAISQDVVGMRRLFRQFSFPGGIPSHASPDLPGSIHEGGELGYSLSHAYGAVFDNPDLIVAAVVGDGEAETGPLATSWHGNKFVDPVRDGVVLPILHLNGYKIANPTILARIPWRELEQLLRGYGHTPYLVSGGFGGEDPLEVHRRFAATLDTVFEQIADIKTRTGRRVERPAWPMIVLRTPKGWTCPTVIDGHPAENSWRSHQVPLANARDTVEHLHVLEQWLRSYRPGELFTTAGAPAAPITDLAPVGERRMSANPAANGGELRRPLRLPDFRRQAMFVPTPGGTVSEPTRVLGRWLRDVAEANPDVFRIFGPDETASNRLGAVFEVTNKQWDAQVRACDSDNHLARSGRVVEMLSEHQCEGWLEGYLLTGRHGLLNSYEAFIHIVDSMINQHAKWLRTAKAVPWRRPVSSLNILLSSHVWRQDHNGLSHQDPGFLDHVANKRADIARIYLPFDANTMLSTTDHCLRSVDYINVIVAGKQPSPNWLSMPDAIEHCTRGLGILDWAGTEQAGHEPDVVLAAAGDVPTLEMLAAVSILRARVPALRVRVVNVVDLMRLQSDRDHPHGLADDEYDAVFTTDKPVIFAFHGFPGLIHRLTYRRHGHEQLHVHGFREEGTTTTPFDMLLLNELDRYRLVIGVLDHVPGLAAREAALRQDMVDARVRARAYTREHGIDIPEVTGWRWPRTETPAEGEG